MVKSEVNARTNIRELTNAGTCAGSRPAFWVYKPAAPTSAVLFLPHQTWTATHHSSLRRQLTTTHDNCSRQLPTAGHCNGFFLSTAKFNCKLHRGCIASTAPLGEHHWAPLVSPYRLAAILSCRYMSLCDVLALAASADCGLVPLRTNLAQHAHVPRHRESDNGLLIPFPEQVIWTERFRRLRELRSFARLPGFSRIHLRVPGAKTCALPGWYSRIYTTHFFFH